MLSFTTPEEFACRASRELLSLSTFYLQKTSLHDEVLQSIPGTAEVRACPDALHAAPLIGLAAAPD